MHDFDPDLYRDREQAYIKHRLLEEYLPEWGFKVGRHWDLVFVDGFAGPWGVQSEDHADSSFGIAVNSLKSVVDGLAKQGRSVKVRFALVEKDLQRFESLSKFAERERANGVDIHTFHGALKSVVPEICRCSEQLGLKVFKFVFLDPYGWKEIPLVPLLPLIQDRSCEVVVNLMTKHIRRFLQEENRSQSFEDLFGRPGALEIVRDAEDQVGEVVRQYCKSLKALAKFEFVSSAVVFEPGKGDIRYFLVFGTNHIRGIEVFKDAESRAAKIQDEIRHESEVRAAGGQLSLDGLFGANQPKETFALVEWRAYCKLARDRTINLLLEAPPSGCSYGKLFAEAMSYPLVTVVDFIGWLDGWEKKGLITIRLEGNDKGHRRRKPSADKEDYVLLTNSQRFGSEAS